jgi:virulence-associated protein VapD
VRKGKDDIIEASFKEVMQMGLECMKVKISENMKQTRNNVKEVSSLKMSKIVTFDYLLQSGKNKLSKVLDCLNKMKRLRQLDNCANSFQGFIKCTRNFSAPQILSFGVIC